jgi:ribosomal protein L11 methyltransferase
VSRTWPVLDIVFPSSNLALRDRVLAALDDFPITALDDSTDVQELTWRAFFSAKHVRDAAAAALGTRFARDGLRVVPAEAADEAWAERSQAALRAIRIGRLLVAPPWDLPIATPDPGTGEDLVITINPSMGFGTGHHASTRVCLIALQAIALDGREVLDVGTGSGLLAIAAVRLGAATALGLDIDPDAIAAAAENVRLNDLASRVTLQCRDVRVSRELRADLVLANLTAALLEQTADAIGALVRPDGQLVLSGFTRSYEPTVRAAFEARGSVRRRDEDEDWVALTLQIR